MLRARPHERSRMTRGRCGSLLLHRVTLSFTTPRRFNPAHGGRPMGQILGLGITHYPPLSYKGNMTSRIKLLLADPLLLAGLRSSWGLYPPLREQCGTADGAHHSVKQRNDLILH